MLDFNNLTQEQQDFFNKMWENHLQQSNNETESVQRFKDYADKRRKQEESQEQAASHLKSLMK